MSDTSVVLQASLSPRRSRDLRFRLSYDALSSDRLRFEVTRSLYSLRSDGDLVFRLGPWVSEYCSGRESAELEIECLCCLAS